MVSNFTECISPSLTAVDFVDVIVSVWFGMIAIIGNIVLIIALYRESMFNMGGYLTLAHFSVCDFLNGFVAMYYYPIGVLGKHHYPWVTPIIMFAEASRKVFNTYMPISRFIVIIFPFKGMYFDLYYTKFWLAIVWVMCIACTIPMTFPSHGIVLNTEINQWAKNPDGPAFFPIYSLMCNVIPTVLMVIMYPCCFYKLVKQSRQVATSQNSNEQISKREIQILRLFAANAFIFMLYWFPFYVSMLSGAPYVPHLMEIARGVQSAYNPFIYYLLNPSVRKAVKNLFTGDGSALASPFQTSSHSTRQQNYEHRGSHVPHETARKWATHYHR